MLLPNECAILTQTRDCIWNNDQSWRGAGEIKEESVLWQIIILHLCSYWYEGLVSDRSVSCYDRSLYCISAVIDTRDWFLIDRCLVMTDHYTASLQLLIRGTGFWSISVLLWQIIILHLCSYWYEGLVSDRSYGSVLLWQIIILHLCSYWYEGLVSDRSVSCYDRSLYCISAAIDTRDWFLIDQCIVMIRSLYCISAVIDTRDWFLIDHMTVSCYDRSLYCISAVIDTRDWFLIDQCLVMTDHYTASLQLLIRGTGFWSISVLLWQIIILHLCSYWHEGLVSDRSVSCYDRSLYCISAVIDTRDWFLIDQCLVMTDHYTASLQLLIRGTGFWSISVLLWQIIILHLCSYWHEGLVSDRSVSCYDRSLYRISAVIDTRDWFLIDQCLVMTDHYTASLQLLIRGTGFWSISVLLWQIIILHLCSYWYEGLVSDRSVSCYDGSLYCISAVIDTRDWFLIDHMTVSCYDRSLYCISAVIDTRDWFLIDRCLVMTDHYTASLQLLTRGTGFWSIGVLLWQIIILHLCSYWYEGLVSDRSVSCYDRSLYCISAVIDTKDWFLIDQCLVMTDHYTASLQLLIRGTGFWSISVLLWQIIILHLCSYWYEGLVSDRSVSCYDRSLYRISAVIDTRDWFLIDRCLVMTDHYTASLQLLTRGTGFWSISVLLWQIIILHLCSYWHEGLVSDRSYDSVLLWQIIILHLCSYWYEGLVSDRSYDSVLLWQIIILHLCSYWHEGLVSDRSVSYDRSLYCISAVIDTRDWFLIDQCLVMIRSLYCISAVIDTRDWFLIDQCIVMTDHYTASLQLLTRGTGFWSISVLLWQIIILHLCSYWYEGLVSDRSVSCYDRSLYCISAVIDTRDWFLIDHMTVSCYDRSLYCISAVIDTRDWFLIDQCLVMTDHYTASLQLLIRGTGFWSISVLLWQIIILHLCSYWHEGLVSDRSYDSVLLWQIIILHLCSYWYEGLVSDRSVSCYDRSLYCISAVIDTRDWFLIDHMTVSCYDRSLYCISAVIDTRNWFLIDQCLVMTDHYTASLQLLIRGTGFWSISVLWQIIILHLCSYWYEGLVSDRSVSCYDRSLYRISAVIDTRDWFLIDQCLVMTDHYTASLQLLTRGTGFWSIIWQCLVMTDHYTASLQLLIRGTGFWSISVLLWQIIILHLCSYWHEGLVSDRSYDSVLLWQIIIPHLCSYWYEGLVADRSVSYDRSLYCISAVIDTRDWFLIDQCLVMTDHYTASLQLLTRGTGFWSISVLLWQIIIPHLCSYWHEGLVSDRSVSCYDRSLYCISAVIDTRDWFLIDQCLVMTDHYTASLQLLIRGTGFWSISVLLWQIIIPHLCSYWHEGLVSDRSVSCYDRSLYCISAVIDTRDWFLIDQCLVMTDHYTASLQLLIRGTGFWSISVLLWQIIILHLCSYWYEGLVSDRSVSCYDRSLYCISAVIDTRDWFLIDRCLVMTDHYTASLQLLIRGTGFWSISVLLWQIIIPHLCSYWYEGLVSDRSYDSVLLWQIIILHLCSYWYEGLVSDRSYGRVLLWQIIILHLCSYWYEGLVSDRSCLVMTDHYTAALQLLTRGTGFWSIIWQCLVMTDHYTASLQLLTRGTGFWSISVLLWQIIILHLCSYWYEGLVSDRSVSCYDRSLYCISAVIDTRDWFLIDQCLVMTDHYTASLQLLTRGTGFWSIIWQCLVMTDHYTASLQLLIRGTGFWSIIWQCLVMTDHYTASLQLLTRGTGFWSISVLLWQIIILHLCSYWHEGLVSDRSVSCYDRSLYCISAVIDTRDWFLIDQCLVMTDHYTASLQLLTRGTGFWSISVLLWQIIILHLCSYWYEGLVSDRSVSCYDRSLYCISAVIDTRDWFLIDQCLVMTDHYTASLQLLIRGTGFWSIIWQCLVMTDHYTASLQLLIRGTGFWSISVLLWQIIILHLCSYWHEGLVSDRSVSCYDRSLYRISAVIDTRDWFLIDQCLVMTDHYTASLQLLIRGTGFWSISVLLWQIIILHLCSYWYEGLVSDRSVSCYDRSLYCISAVIDTRDWFLIDQCLVMTDHYTASLQLLTRGTGFWSISVLLWQIIILHLCSYWIRGTGFWSISVLLWQIIILHLCSYWHEGLVSDRSVSCYDRIIIPHLCSYWYEGLVSDRSVSCYDRSLYCISAVIDTRDWFLIDQCLVMTDHYTASLQLLIRGTGFWSISVLLWQIIILHLCSYWYEGLVSDRSVSCYDRSLYCISAVIDTRDWFLIDQCLVMTDHYTSSLQLLTRGTGFWSIIWQCLVMTDHYTASLQLLIRGTGFWSISVLLWQIIIPHLCSYWHEGLVSDRSVSCYDRSLYCISAVIDTRDWFLIDQCLVMTDHYTASLQLLIRGTGFWSIIWQCLVMTDHYTASLQLLTRGTGFWSISVLLWQIIILHLCSYWYEGLVSDRSVSCYDGSLYCIAAVIDTRDWFLIDQCLVMTDHYTASLQLLIRGTGFWSISVLLWQIIILHLCSYWYEGLVSDQSYDSVLLWQIIILHLCSYWYEGLVSDRSYDSVLLWQIIILHLCSYWHEGLVSDRSYDSVLLWQIIILHLCSYWYEGLVSDRSYDSVLLWQIIILHLCSYWYEGLVSDRSVSCYDRSLYRISAVIDTRDWFLIDQCLVMTDHYTASLQLLIRGTGFWSISVLLWQIIILHLCSYWYEGLVSDRSYDSVLLWRIIILHLCSYWHEGLVSDRSVSCYDRSLYCISAVIDTRDWFLIDQCLVMTDHYTASLQLLTRGTGFWSIIWQCCKHSDLIGVLKSGVI